MITFENYRNYRITYQDVCHDLLSRIYSNTERIMEEYQYKTASEYMDRDRNTTNLDITMKNMIYVQVVECHQKLNKPLTKFLIKVSDKDSQNYKLLTHMIVEYCARDVKSKSTFQQKEKENKNANKMNLTSSEKRTPLAFFIASALYHT